MMPNYRRYYVPGGTYFFTVVTDWRRPLFADEAARVKLQSAIDEIQAKRPFEIVATVLLPDHLHCIWNLPPGDADYSLRWAQIKEGFTRTFLQAGGEDGLRSESRLKHRERAVWQRRFWEHTVEDEDDLKRCIDYIHWNPVKHGYVTRVRDWPDSSFLMFVDRGEYALDWGRVNPCAGYDEPEWE
jgi:putative transposase